jgi:phage tail sheath protein FI
MADNSSRKFKFISPGVFVNEIDNSQLPETAGDIGPLILGTAARGPLNKPVTVTSFNDFVQVFGNPVAGNEGTDLWRNDALNAPTYGAYAAQAWLRNNSPLTYMRVGQFTDPSTSNEAGFAGWRAGNIAGTAAATAANGGSFQLVVWPSSSLSTQNLPVSGAVAATIYLDAGRAFLSGTRVDGTVTGSVCELYTTDANNEIVLDISSDGTLASSKKVSVSFDPSSKNYFRNVLNTNPTVTNSTITTAATQASNEGGEYWVGESFARRLATTGSTLGNNAPETVSSLGLLASAVITSGSSPTNYHVALLPMRNQASNTTTQNNKLYGATRSTTGWFISQDLSSTPSAYQATSMQQLFRFEALSEGDSVQKQVKISISNIKAPQGAFEDYGTFSVLIRSINDTDAVPQVLERFDELSLNPASPNYIARKIGDQYEQFDTATLTNRQYGQYQNQSRFIRVVMNEDVDRGGAEPLLLPYGVFGPLKNRDISLISGSGAPQPEGAYGKTWLGSAFTSGACAAGAYSMVDGGPETTFAVLGGMPAAIATEPMVLGFGAFAHNTTSATATATIVVTDSGGLANGETFVLIDSAGLSTTYTINSGIAPDAGGGNGGAAVVGINGVGGGAAGKVLAAAALATAITSDSGTGSGTTDANYTAVSNGVDTVTITQGTAGTAGNRTSTDGAGGITVGNFTGGLQGSAVFSASIQNPSVPLRSSNQWGTPKNLQSTYWGAWTGRSTSDTTYDPGITDYLTARASGLQTNPWSTSHDISNNPTTTRAGNDPVEISWVFTLDDISGSINSGEYYYVSGSRTAGTSYRGTNSYTTSLDLGLDRFTTVLFGGSTGYNVMERDPFRNSLIGAAATDATSAPLYSLKRAIDTVSDADQLQYNVITMPGVTNNLVTNHLLSMVDERADALAIIDLPYVYTADTENSASAADRNAFTIAQAINDLKSRNINNSYGAAYYPWVLIQDTINNRTLWAPPSVAALGALSTTDRIAAPWFAPAGFSRGGLSEGAAGIPVLEVSRRLTSDDRDDLYEANINPIAKFPAEGIVIFGQKTLQQTASALDRINVRRLMIYLKREISFIASRLLFAPNTRDTWTRFIQQATPVLDAVRSQFGIEDFRLILDESTTTPDMIDRNIIYAKLIVKPTRAAEYFAIDFVVTNSGAAFDD